MIVAVAQTRAAPDEREALGDAQRLVCEAVGKGAEFVVLPELFSCVRRPADEREAAFMSQQEDGRITQALARAARGHAYVCVGYIRNAGDNRLMNSATLIAPSGAVVKTWDAEIPTGVESLWTYPMPIIPSGAVELIPGLGRVGVVINPSLRSHPYTKGSVDTLIALSRDRHSTVWPPTHISTLNAELGCAVIYANIVDKTSNGGSCVIMMDGTPVSYGSAFCIECVVGAQINNTEIA